MLPWLFEGGTREEQRARGPRVLLKARGRRERDAVCGALDVLPGTVRRIGRCGLAPRCVEPVVHEAIGQPFRSIGQESERNGRSEEHTSELQSLAYLVCRLLLEKKKKKMYTST